MSAIFETIEGDEWTVMDTNGDLTGRTIRCLIEPVPTGPSVELDVETVDVVAGTIKARSVNLAQGRYRVQLPTLPGKATYPNSGYGTLIVHRRIPDPTP